MTTMKIIQSFWSNPAFHSVQNYSNARKFGGWLNFKYFLISAAYSCLTLRKHHKKIYLYTDTQGQELMDDLLQLPFEEISTSLDELDSEDHRLWIRGKMNVIEQQHEPFIHVDNDIYIWEPLPDPKKIIVQSRFPIWGEYQLSLNEIFANFDYIPECLQERPTDKTTVANVGLIGGHDIDFFQRFCENSRNLLERNRQFLPLINIGGFNQMMEEYLFTSMLRHEDKDVFYLLENLNTPFPASHLNFSLVPAVYRYIHLIGHHKQSAYACEQLELRLKYEFPETFRRVVEVLGELGVDETDTKTDEVRRTRLLRSLQILHQSDLDSIRKMKIRIKPGADIIRIDDYLTNEFRYAVRESDCPALYNLPQNAIDGLGPWLDEPARRIYQPFTIDQLTVDYNLQQPAQLALINSIAYNLVHTGLMEFA
jgi:hypothetical protein